jgi:hypothetical protein
MTLFRFTIPAVFLVTESDPDWDDAIGRAAQFIADFEVGPYELVGYNRVAGTDLRNMSASPLRSNSVQFLPSPANGGVARVKLAATLEIDLAAPDAETAGRDARDALAIYEFSAALLGGYNGRAGTTFTAFDVEDLGPHTVVPINEDGDPLELAAAA